MSSSGKSVGEGAGFAAMRLSGWRWSLATVLCAAVAAACGGGEADGPSTALAPTSTTATTTTAAAAASIDWDYTDLDSRPVVALLDAGEEPTEVRVYSPEVGAMRSVVVRTETAIAQLVNAEENPDTTYATEMELTGTVIAVDGSGITLKQTFGSFSVGADDPLVKADVAAYYAQLEGASVYVLISPRGERLAVSLDELPPELSLMAQAVSTVPFPTEAIGQGAEWEVMTTTETFGLSSRASSRIRLVEINGPLLVFEAQTTAEVGADDSAIRQEATVGYSAVGSGAETGVFDLNNPTPSESTTSTDQTVETVVFVDGEERTLVQTITMVSTLDER